jgi:hypothetical protein
MLYKYHITEEIENRSTYSYKAHWVCQNTREVLRSTMQKCFITAHSTTDKFSIFFIKYKSLRSLAHAVGSYKARATANQITRNMLVIF